MENKIISKGLKSFLTAKKYYDTDIDKSFEYFKQCIAILNDVKEKNIKVDNELSLLIDETETECSKYLTMTIESTIDKPNQKIYKNNSNDNILFEIIETGSINKLKEYKYNELDFMIYNSVGNTPLHHAIKYGDTTFLKHAFKLGANIDSTNMMGHTLLEYACLEKDPNLINFMITYGSDMKKHLKFREGKRYYACGTQIDTMLIEKIILNYSNNNIIYMDWIFKYIDKSELLDIQLSPDDKTLTNITLIQCIDRILSTLSNEMRTTYIDIIKEELDYELHFKLGCPHNLIEIILYNIVPFIDYNENLRYNWLLSLEIKFLILKILKNKVKINTKQLKLELKELLEISYSNVSNGLIQTLVLQWLNKIKV
jgi:hypothetical protein